MTLIQMLRPLLTCLALAAYSATLLADAPIIAVDAIYPPILSTQHDNRVKVTSGRFTQDIEGLVFSDPRITAVLDAAPNLPLDDQPQKQFGSFNIKVDPSLPEGFYEVAAVGRYGISNTRILAVLHTPVELIPGNIDPKSPPEVKPGTCYVGLTKRSDNVLLKAKKTDHWPKCLVVAQTLDTWTIPSLIVSDSSNRVLNQLRGQGKQPILFTKPVNEPKEPVDDVLFRVHDFLYRAGDPFAFALVIDPADNHLLLQPTPANPIYSIFQDPIPQWPIIDANSLGAIKTLPPPPWQTTIELLPSNSPYELEFPVAENASYECEVFSSAIGQLSDIRVVADRIAPPFTPEQIAEIQGALSAPAGSNIEPALQQRIKDYKARTTAIGREVFNVAEDGINAGTKAVRLLSPDPLFAIPAGPTDKHVRLRIEDLQLTPSAKKPTRVVVRVGPPTPRFHAVGHWIPDTNNSAQAKTTGVCLSKGGQAALQVSVRRAGGFNAPIQIACDGLPPGVTAHPAVIGPNQTETQLVFFAEENAAAWAGPIQPFAKATWVDGNNQPQEIRIPLRVATISLSASGDRGLPQSRLSNLWLLKVSDQDTAPIQMRAGDGPGWVLEIPQGGSAKIPIKAARRAGGDQKGIMRPQNLPPKVTLGEFELPPNAAEASPEIKVAADAEVGEYLIYFQTEIVIKQSLHPESHARLVAYRDRIAAKLADPNWQGDRPAAEKIIAETNPKIEAVAKEIAPRDFPTFVPSAPFRLKIIPAPAPQK